MNSKRKSMQYVPYQRISQEEFEKEYKKIVDLWNIFIELNDPDLVIEKDYFIHKKNMYEVIDRTHKRKAYYEVFHNLKQINEFKEVALNCYWINTLKPFMVTNPESDIYNSPNELFTVFLIVNTVQSIYEEEHGEGTFKYPTNKRIADMVYNFKYCDLSREATIAFVETFADNYGIGIQYILDNKVNN